MRMIPRDGWNPQYANGFERRAIPVREAFIHHTVTKSPGRTATLKADVAAIRGLEAIGQDRFGGGISYNRLILASGRVFIGVSGDRVGAHTMGHNETAMGYALVGNYDANPLSETMARNLAWAMRDDIRRGFLAKDCVIRGHRDVKATACPGKNAYAMLPKIISWVRHGWMPVLKFGMRSGDVLTLKAALSRAGYSGFILGNSGFGPGTLKAVKKLQLDRRIPVTGVSDSDTWMQLGY